MAYVRQIVQCSEIELQLDLSVAVVNSKLTSVSSCEQQLLLPDGPEVNAAAAAAAAAAAETKKVLNADINFSAMRMERHI